MTELLVKLFIKDNDNIQDQRVRTSYGILAGIVGIVCNIILFIVKLTVGILIKSVSVMADAFNNLSDAGSSIIGFIGVKLAGRPADKEHPFGHGRMEYIAALAVSFVIIQVSLSLFKNSFEEIFKPEDVIFSPVLIGILVISIFIKVWLVLLNRKLGKRVKSSVMLATAADSLSDVLVTSATIVSAVIAGLTGLKIDGYMGLVVSVFVFIAGVKIAKETLEPLLGQAVDRELYKKITDFVESYPNIVGSHDLIIHSYGPTHRMATIHAEVPNDINIEKMHEIIDRIERDILDKMGIFLVIHMDPVEMNDALVLDYKRIVTDIIKKLDAKASIHDFRVVKTEFQINLIFDLSVPFSYSPKEEERLLKGIMEEVKKHDARLNCVITLENSYIAEE